MGSDANLNLHRTLRSAGRLMRRPLRQQRLVVEATLTLCSVKLLLLCAPFERWRKVLKAPAGLSQVTPISPERIDEVLWAVHRVSQPWGAALTCLPRAIAVSAMMARRRWDHRLEIGVALDEDGKFSAHAWVTHRGRTIVGDLPDLARYARLPIEKSPDR